MQSLVVGDRLLFYTDGFIEAMNVVDRPLGLRGLARFALEFLGEELFDMAEKIVARVAKYRAGPSHDDMTLIVAEIK